MYTNWHSWIGVSKVLNKVKDKWEWWMPFHYFYIPSILNCPSLILNCVSICIMSANAPSFLSSSLEESNEILPILSTCYTCECHCVSCCKVCGRLEPLVQVIVSPLERGLRLQSWRVVETFSWGNRLSWDASESRASRMRLHTSYVSINNYSN